MGLVNQLSKLRQYSRLPVTKFSGREKVSGSALDLLYAGTPSQQSFVKNLWFSDNVVETELGAHFAWSLNRVATSNGCQMVTAIQSVDAQSLLPKSGYVLPLWVTSIADTSTAPYKISDKSLKADLARIRRNKLECEHSRSPEDFKYFWERMYVPYMKSQHTDEAIIGSCDEFYQLLLDGNLILAFALLDGQRVAGGTLKTKGPIPSSHHLGLLDADHALKPLGALAAIYVFELDWAWRNGHRRLILGGNRPFLRDGVLQYKKKFNVTLSSNGLKRVIYINPVQRTDAVVAALASNPMICVEEGDMVATVFESDQFKCSMLSPPWLHHGKLMAGLKDVKRISLG